MPDRPALVARDVVAALSVGQPRRLGLALLVAQAPHVRLLDEPTNHLSLTLVDELEEALGATPGALVAASHDRWLRRRWPGPSIRLEKCGRRRPLKPGRPRRPLQSIRGVSRPRMHPGRRNGGSCANLRRICTSRINGGVRPVATLGVLAGPCGYRVTTREAHRRRQPSHPDRATAHWAIVDVGADLPSS